METKKIVAIGGGENGRKGTTYETEAIDREIVKLTGKKKPNFLFIGFASDGQIESYFRVMKRHYKNLGCIQCDCILKKELTLENSKQLESRILNADIIYVGGGNTLKLMHYFKKYGIDKMLVKAYNQGIVMCGISAGAICWCQYGNSDSRRFTSNSNQLIKVTGLGMLPILVCPHYNKEIARQEDLKRMMKTTYKIPAIALDDGTAIEVEGNQFRIITSLPNAKARKCYWKAKQYIVHEIPLNQYMPIEELIKK